MLRSVFARFAAGTGSMTQSIEQEILESLEDLDPNARLNIPRAVRKMTEYMTKDLDDKVARKIFGSSPANKIHGLESFMGNGQASEENSKAD